MPNQPKTRSRTFDAAAHEPGRYRADSTETLVRPRLSASIAEYCIAKQMARLEMQRER